MVKMSRKGPAAVKNIKMLVWLTQLGMSVALPPLGFIYVAVRLREKFSLGNWVIFAGIALGVLCAIDGLRSSLKAMEKMSETKDKPQPPISFNDHD